MAELREETGHTSEGDVFVVPQSHDMLHTLLDPRLPKTWADYLTVAVLIVDLVIYLLLPAPLRAPVFFVLFLAWRAAYNLGLGFLLREQSERKSLVKLAKRWKLFTESQFWWQRFAQNEVSARTGDVSVPVEYKTWILYRELVDLVLMSDFVTYVLLGISCLHRTNQPWIVVAGRWIAGWILVIFNLYVKIDAHRVVKDYAWFWGDFFFLKDGELTFDGVFELAPHPMYTIGYAGYYGLSLLTASSTLFAASLIAHAAQFAFLVIVENPHIDRTYPQLPASHEEDDPAPPHVRAMLGFRFFNFTRPSDIQLVALAITHALLVFFPSSPLATLITVGLAFCWRTAHTVGLGVLLQKQSESKLWTRLFLKYGMTRSDAYQAWQALYNTTTVMSWVTLSVVAFREWSSSGASATYQLFRWIVGAMLISLHIWTSNSIWNELGEFGWFFGDFFWSPRVRSLSASGIYRYLNHPERIVGVSGVWGIALVTASTPVVIISMIWTVYNLAFIQYVEKPNMVRLYGAESVSRQSGVSRNWKRSWNSAKPVWLERTLVSAWQRTVVARLERIEELKPRVDGVVGDTRQALGTRYHPSAMASALYPPIDRAGATVRSTKSVYSFGEPIAVEWAAPHAMDKKNWIGLYRSRDRPGTTTTTRISSAGRWVGVDAKGYSDHISGIEAVGRVRFDGESQYLEPGEYELRLHYAGKHQVLAISPHFTVEVQRCDPLKATDLAADLQGLAEKCEFTWDGDNKRLARFTSALRCIYGVDLAPFVVRADGSPYELEKRVKNYAQSLSDDF